MSITLKDADQAIRYAFDDATNTIKVSGTFTSTNAANGATGAPVPAQATQVAGADPTGNLEALKVDASGSLLVSIASEPGAPFHTIVDSSALPTGAATAAAQATQITSLASIATNTTGASTAANQTTANASLSSIDTKTPALGQALAAASTPVVLTAAQVSTLTPLATVAVTQSTGTNLHTVIDSSALPTGASTLAEQALQLTQETAIAGSTASIDTKSTTIVTNTSNTATSTASIDTKTPTVGQKAMAASSPVVFASDQSSIPVTGTVTNASIGPTAAAIPTSATMVGGSDGTNIRAMKVSAAGVVSVDASGTTINTNVSSVNGSITLTGNGSTGTGSQRVTIASDNTAFPVNATLQASAAVIGHVITDAGSAIIGKVGIDQTTPGTTNGVQINAALPTGANVIGALTANQSVNNAQINGISPLMGNGVTGTGSQRVTIASDNTAFSVNSVQSGTWTVQPGNTANTTAWLVAEEKSATATLTNVAGSATTVSLLALNTSRKQALFYNDSTAILYLKFGATASLTSYTVQIPANGYYELPGVRVYTGAVDGIWASANGNVRITELT